MVGCGANLHPTLRSFAQSQDQIGWRRFMEGMVSKELVTFGCLYGMGGTANWTQRFG